MAEHNKLGEIGEKIALTFLVELDYKIIETNWRQRKFEIDIIAKDKEEIVFIEVKTRSTAIFGEPEEAITSKKQQHLVEGADCYIQEKEIDLDGRFDVISIVLNSTQKEIKHIKSAFYPEV
jgi:putative endonuclease